MVPFNEGDGPKTVAQIVREQREDEARAREQARQASPLMPPEIAAKLPPLYSQEEHGENAIAQVNFFTPRTSWTWYASEYDPVERLCFGVVVGIVHEYGTTGPCPYEIRGGAFPPDGNATPVCEPIQISPPSKCSFFQIGTICLRRSIA